jgi:hypothetical protein
VFGGAAMALAYDSRRATRDVDALFKPHGIVLKEALAVAAELGLPRWAERGPGAAVPDRMPVLVGNGDAPSGPGVTGRGGSQVPGQVRVDGADPEMKLDRSANGCNLRR